MQLITDRRSLIKMMKSNGPSTEPCGTPLTTFSQLDTALPRTTRCLRPVRKSSTHLSSLSSSPKCRSLNMSTRWDSLSNALVKSRKTASAMKPLLRVSVMRSRNSIRLVMHDRLWTKPCYSVVISLFAVRCITISFIFSIHNQSINNF